MIDLARRNVEAFGDDQEMMYERVHVRLHRLAIRQHDLRRISFDGAGAQARKSLRTDLVRLFQLAHTHHVARPDIAVRLDRNLEIILLVTRIWIRAPHIYLVTA